MEKTKLSKKEREERLNQLREERIAKQNARIEKMKQMNLQKYNSEAQISSNSLKPAQSRPRNFNSMTDLRRKSMMPKTDAKINKTTSKLVTKKAGEMAHPNSEITLTDFGNASDDNIDGRANVNALNENISVGDGNSSANDKNFNKVPSSGASKTVKKNIAKLPLPHVKSVPKVTSFPKVASVPKVGGAPKTNIANLNQSIQVKDANCNTQKPRQSIMFEKAKARQSLGANLEKKSSAIPTKMSNIKQYEAPRPEIVMKYHNLPSKTASAKKIVQPKSEIPSFIPPEKRSFSARKSLLPKPTVSPSKMSVFERLSRPKNATEKPKPIRKENIFEQKRRLATKLAGTRLSLATFEPMKDNVPNMRRSISAVHFKRISKDELKKCIHRASSIDELDKMDLTRVDEDAAVVQDQIVSAVKSDRIKKTVKFQKVTSFMNVNTPRADDLQRKLKSWLQKRGKSLDSYHHLQCFGIHRLAPTQKATFDFKDEEDKENIEVMIPDDASFTDNINDRFHDFDEEKIQWRESSPNDSGELNDSQTPADTTFTSGEPATPKVAADELVLSALADLSQLVREGFEWEQCARWLRAIRERCPRAPDVAAYWECRAALEERQGNLTGSCQCWEEAIAKGTETSIAEASLDQLLDKFMQLNISPSREPRPRPCPDPKMLDVKNVFKSTLIRFAVQKAKLLKAETPKYTVTPVRRSNRLSICPGPITQTPDPLKTTPYKPSSGKKRTPLVQLCSSLKQIDEEIRDMSVFVPNRLLHFSP